MTLNVLFLLLIFFFRAKAIDVSYYDCVDDCIADESEQVDDPLPQPIIEPQPEEPELEPEPESDPFPWLQRPKTTPKPEPEPVRIPCTKGIGGNSTNDNTGISTNGTLGCDETDDDVTEDLMADFGKVNENTESEEKVTDDVGNGEKVDDGATKGNATISGSQLEPLEKDAADAMSLINALSRRKRSTNPISRRNRSTNPITRRKRSDSCEMTCKVTVKDPLRCLTCDGDCDTSKTQLCKPHEACWTVLTNENNASTYRRMCMNTDDNRYGFICDSHMDQACYGTTERIVCARCCKHDKCNVDMLTVRFGGGSSRMAVLDTVVVLFVTIAWLVN